MKTHLLRFCSTSKESATRLKKWNTFMIKNRPTPAFFSFIFGLFKQTNITIFISNQCEKMAIQYTARPLKHEPSPLTTRPGLPP